ncbi:hypothetical protein XENTR_v10021930 [Xenopus tropicalis]|nr:hypothetical protein XENTR_v10021930 [Xenopus tropicalis]
MNDSREEELSWNMEEQGLSASNISRNSQMFMGYFIAAAANLLVVTVMLSLGCTMEILEIKKHLLKPKGIGIALFSQFGIMPLAAFSLAHVFQLNAIESVTVLICGCCPGGVLSSVFSLALKGDINLSILMTTTSTVLALGMMPLLLFIYSLVLDMEPIHNAVPLEKIIEILVLTVFPCCSGILINTKRPQYSGWVVKIAVGISAVVSILIVTLSFLYMRSDIFLILSPPLLYTSGLMTLIGYVLGYSISAAFKLNGQYRRTVSMETGCQNVQLCATILQVSFSPGVLGPMYAFPFLHVTLQILEGLLLILAFRLYQKIKATGKTAW